MPTNDISGIVKNLNQLLAIGMPSAYSNLSITPALDMDTRKRMSAFANLAKKGGMGSAKETPGISLPNLMTDYNQGVMAPVLHNTRRPASQRLGLPFTTL